MSPRQFRHKLPEKPHQEFLDGVDFDQGLQRLRECLCKLEQQIGWKEGQHLTSDYLACNFRRVYRANIGEVLLALFEQKEDATQRDLNRLLNYAVKVGDAFSVAELLKKGARPLPLEAQADTMLVVSKDISCLRVFQKIGYDLSSLAHEEVFKTDYHGNKFVDSWFYLAVEGLKPLQIENLTRLGARQETQSFCKSAVLDAIQAKNEKIARSMMYFWPFNHNFGYSKKCLVTDIYYACKRTHQEHLYKEMEPYLPQRQKRLPQARAHLRP